MLIQGSEALIYMLSIQRIFIKGGCMEYKKRYKGWPGLNFLGNLSSVCSQERQMQMQRTVIR